MEKLDISICNFVEFKYRPFVFHFDHFEERIPFCIGGQTVSLQFHFEENFDWIWTSIELSISRWSTLFLCCHPNGLSLNFFNMCVWYFPFNRLEHMKKKLKRFDFEIPYRQIDTKCTGTTRNFLHCLHSSRYVSVNRIIECSWLFNRKGYLRENFEIPLKLVSFAGFFEMQVAKIANGYGWHHDCDALRLFEYIGGKSLHRTRLFGKLILIHRIRHHLQFT